VLAGETVPQNTPVQDAPVAVQLTPLFCGSFNTVAVSCTVVFTCTAEGFGEIVTEIGGTSVMVAESDLLESVTEVAVSVTVFKGGEGMGETLGAAYVTELPTVWSNVPHPPWAHSPPDKLQVVVWLAALGVTVAANCFVPPA
jgi:hypothetical protein